MLPVKPGGSIEARLFSINFNISIGDEKEYLESSK